MANAESHRPPAIEQVSGEPIAPPASDVHAKKYHAPISSRGSLDVFQQVERVLGGPGDQPESDPVEEICRESVDLGLPTELVDSNAPKSARLSLLSQMVDLVLYHCGEFEEASPIGLAKQEFNKKARQVAEMFISKPELMGRLRAIGQRLHKRITRP